MCAILDANVAWQVFGAERPPAGRAFFDRIDSGWMLLVVGGRLRRELDRSEVFQQWRHQAERAGRIALLNDDAVDETARQLERENACRSDDEHVVAVAQLSGARLLYSNDAKLQEDFTDKALVDRPRGKVYSTRLRDGPDADASAATGGPEPMQEQPPVITCAFAVWHLEGTRPC